MLVYFVKTVHRRVFSDLFIFIILLLARAAPRRARPRRALWPTVLQLAVAVAAQELADHVLPPLDHRRAVVGHGRLSGRSARARGVWLGESREVIDARGKSELAHA